MGEQIHRVEYATKDMKKQALRLYACEGYGPAVLLSGSGFSRRSDLLSVI